MRKMAALAIALVALVGACSASEEGDALAAKIKAIKMPQPTQADTGADGPSIAFMNKLRKYYQERNDLIWKLFQIDPKNTATAPLLEERWSTFEAPVTIEDPGYVARLKADVEKALASNPPAEIVEVARFCLAEQQLGPWISDVDLAIRVCEEFAKRFPKSGRGPRLYLSASASMPEDQRYPLFKSMAEHYPNSEFAPFARGALRQHDEIGRPFTLKFTDAISGKPFDLADCKGKVVLIDFWATWCGPCVEKIPRLKELEAKYGTQGFVIIGVSLDMPESQGGLAKLKSFVAEHSLPWAQFYEGKAPKDSFAAAWGVDIIPTTFLIDRQGLLREVVRKDPEPSIQKLLAEKSG
jgi:thiol-disulfide isomerase/thioredoxin